MFAVHLANPKSITIAGGRRCATHRDDGRRHLPRRVSRHDIAGIWVAFFSRRQRDRCGQGGPLLRVVLATGGAGSGGGRGRLAGREGRMRTIRLPTRAKQESVNKEYFMFRTSAQHSRPSLEGNTEHYAHVFLRRSGRQGRGLVHRRCVVCAAAALSFERRRKGSGCTYS